MKSVLDSKAIQDRLGRGRRTMQAAEHEAKECIRPNQTTIEASFFFKLTDAEINDADKQGTFDNKKDAGIASVSLRRSKSELAEALRSLNIDTWSIPRGKAAGEAEEMNLRFALKEKAYGLTSAYICGLQASQIKVGV